MAEKKEKRYVSDNAQLMAEWNWEKNNQLGLLPDELTIGSHKKVWWICSLGHEWETRIVNRTTGKTSCPYCSGKKVLSGFNDLLTQNPRLASEWHPTKNGEVSPVMVTLHSGKKIWWKCANDHEWQATIANRVNGRGCPYCSGHRVISGVNDLSTLYPNIATEWNTIKNGDLSPIVVSPGSSKKVWWICRKGHEWQATIANRVKGRGCPYCSNKKILPGYNDLATTNSQIASEWHPTKNGDLLPTMVSSGSHKKVWWKCKNGHEWETAIYNRIAGNRCQICAKEKRGKQN